MKLTFHEENSLLQLAEDKLWSKSSMKTPHMNTIKSLVKKGLITERNYANGVHWEMTDKGRHSTVKIILKRK